MKNLLIGLIFLGLAAIFILLFWLKSELPEEGPVVNHEGHQHLPPEDPEVKIADFLSGTVSGGNPRRPLRGARIQLLRLAKETRLVASEFGKVPDRAYPHHEKQSDHAGCFAFAHPGPGEYLLRASLEGFSTVESDTFRIERETDRITQHLILLQGATLEVTFNRKGQPFPGSMVVVLLEEEKPRIQKLDGSGKAILKDLPPGSGWVWIEQAGARVDLLFREPEGKPGFPSNLTLEEGEFKSMDFSGDPEEAARLSGRLTVEGAGPEQAFQIQLHPSFPARQSIYPTRPLSNFRAIPQTIPVRNHSDFRHLELVAGDYEAKLFTAGGVGFSLLRRDVTLRGGEENRLDLVLRVGSCSGTVAGKIQNKSYRVQIRGPEGSPSPLTLAYWTGPQGNFRSALIPEGDYQVIIYTLQGDPIRREISISSGDVDLGTIQVP